ncbi:putative NmrA-like domain-containing protein [Seiridium unicorne]|uniref:NmrA-like domain-containing protein n=1 Tax=Seiridium unicorne TaxID=138068 RepID=A0ABR2V4J0_9PEZI
MVKIAVAGGSGQVAREIIDALVVAKKHDVTILSRTDTPSIDIRHGIHWRSVDYNDKKGLVGALEGIHTVLSFVQILSDLGQMSQKNLIDAAISAGVRRFAPSEYGSKETVEMAWWKGKEEIREYLKQVNEKDNVLEYTLFQPGLFLDYLAFPHKTARHVDPLQSVFDVQNSRAIVLDGHYDPVITLTTVADLAAIVARAVEYQGVWPTTGGIRGNRLKFSQIVEIGSRVRGRPFTVDKATVEDLEAGTLRTSWRLEAVHRAVSEDQSSALLKGVLIGTLLSSLKGAWDITDEMNQLFPDYEFTSAEAFLSDVWKGKP